MEFNHNFAQINNLRMHFVEHSTPTKKNIPVVLCHGFPHTWFSWHRQIPSLSNAGCKVLAPDMRGMGKTSVPKDISAYDVDTICRDLTGLLDYLEIDKAVFIGLDFGAFAIYDLALRFPERVIAVIGLENPAAPHNPNKSPLAEYREMGADHFLHINYFCEKVGPADDDLLLRIDEFFPKVFWALSGEGNYFDTFKFPKETHYIDALNDPPSLPWSWINIEEMQVFIEAYRKSGFTGGLNWYRSMDIKWEQRKPYENVSSNIPAYFLGSENDVDFKGFHGDNPINLLRKQFPKLRAVEMVSSSGHLVQLEKAGEVNTALVGLIEDIREEL